MFRAFVCLVSCGVVSAPLVVHAQIAESVGVRAQGMAGAFTAIADDSSSTWWNPAGQAAGAYFNAILEFAHQRDPRDDRPSADGAVPAWKTASTGVSVAYPALGLSYYHLRVNEIRAVPSTGTEAPGRQDQGSTDVRLRSLFLTQFGATLGQSLSNHLVLASTVKLIRGRAAADVRARGTASLDAAENLGGSTETHAGLDIGALALVGPARLGVIVRNVKEPTFGTGDAAVTLSRQIRTGAAIASRAGRATASADLDLTTTATAIGDERRLAIGGEWWTTARVLGFRGGLNRSVIGDARQSFSGGLSVAVRMGTYVEVAATGGADEARRGWGFALRLTF